MKERNEYRRKQRFYLSLIIFTAIALVVVLNIKQVLGFFVWIWNVIKPLVLGGCIAFVMSILTDWFEKKVFTKRLIKKSGVRNALCLIVALLIIIVVVIGVLWVAIPQLISSFKLLADRIPAAIHAFTKFLRSLTSTYPELAKIAQMIDDNSRNLLNDTIDYFKNVLPETIDQSVRIASGTVSALATFFIGFLFSLYILMYKGKLERQCRQLLYSYLSEKRANQVLYIAHLARKNFDAFIYGQCVEAVILAAMYTVCALIFRLPYTVMIATVFAIFSLIPLFGAWIGWGIGVFLIVTVNPLQAITFTIIFAVVSQIEGNFIYPKIVGSSIGLPGIWVLAAVTVGGNMLGIIGMIIAVPIVALIYTLLSENSQKRLRNHPDRVRDIVHKPSWDQYNPETYRFESTPVHLENVLTEARKGMDKNVEIEKGEDEEKTSSK